jgi:hypothetical protein
MGPKWNLHQNLGKRAGDTNVRIRFDRHPSDYLLDRLARTESVEESLSADREFFIG